MTKNDIDKKKLKVATSVCRRLERTVKEVYEISKRYPNSIVAQKCMVVCEDTFDTLKEIRKTVKLEANQLPKGQLIVDDYTPLDDL